MTGSGYATTSYTYDTDDNLRSVTDGDGRTTYYTFDDFHSLVQVDSPDSGTTRYTYDLSGNLSAKKDSSASSTERFASRTRPSSSTAVSRSSAG